MQSKYLWNKSSQLIPEGCESKLVYFLDVVAGMVAKSRISMFEGGFQRLLFTYFLFIGLLVCQEDGSTVNAQFADAGRRYLDEKELEARTIARSAEMNDMNCATLDNCSAECSRVTCYPIIRESFPYIGIDNNQDKTLLDYNRSFVTLPAHVSTNLQTDVAKDICLQRMLDSTFKNVSVQSEYNMVYFGSTSGAFRAFPGREKNPTQCTSFDPRKRPWYLNGISVSRDVKILVDVANSLGNLVPVDYNRLPQNTYLDVVKDITLELLMAFSPGDYVEVISFDSVTATSLGGAFWVNTPYDYFNPSGHPELGALVTDVNSLAASPLPTTSDLNGAISKAANSFNQLQSLKVIIVLSDGLFVVNSTTFPSADLLKIQVKLMVYKLPTNFDGGDRFLMKTSFERDICSVEGSFELLDPLATANPLYSMRSYFTYLARVELAAAGNGVTWSNKYASILDQNVITPTYPAFGSDGLLIGVAGIDVVIDSLGDPLKTLVLQDFTRRNRGTLPAPAIIKMSCSYQNASANLELCSSSTPPDSSSICPRTDTSIKDLTCCGICGLSEASRKKPWMMEVILIAAVALVAITVARSYNKFKTGSMWMPWWTSKSISPVEVDLLDLNLCEYSVHKIEDLVNSRGSSKRKSNQNLLNKRQCLDLSSKISKTTQNIRQIIVFHCRASAILFKPALEKLYRDLEKAKLLVDNCSCGEGDWCTASVFQIHNEIAFQEILLDVGLCYNAIYELARNTSEERNFPEDLRQSSVFMPASQSDIYEDQLELTRRLEALASGRSGSLEGCLARYLLVKLNHTFDLSEASTSDTCSTISWAKETEPPGTWGGIIRFLGAGSGANGVCSTTWMGILCAKKEFHLEKDEPVFLKEASILAHLKHPYIVTFFCCGNGEQKEHRFIAMELMEKSLANLIKDQGAVYFSLPVVVDIMVQMARGMCYLHGQGIAHRDLKPLNVVVNTLKSPDLVDYYFVKLVDFGMSKTKVQASKSNTISVPGVGTTNYRAPEVHPKAHSDGVGKAGWFKADVFSFAMTCAHILSLKKPFGDTQMSEVFKDLADGRRPALPPDCPRELYALLRDCWDANPRFRPSFVEICTRLEAFRHQILQGFPTSEPRLQLGRSDQFIQKEFSRIYVQGPFDATSDVELQEINLSGFPISGADIPETFEIAQRRSQQRSRSF